MRKAAYLVDGCCSAVAFAYICLPVPPGLSLITADNSGEAIDSIR